VFSQSNKRAGSHMRKHELIAAALIFVFLAPPLQAKTPDPVQLIRQKEYLEAESALAADRGLSQTDRAFLEGVMANRRNQVQKSIRLLTRLLPSLARGSRGRAIIALSTLADDYEKSFRYGDAANAYTELGRRYGTYMTETERRRARNEAMRWNLLRGAPPQQVTVVGFFRVPTTRDRMGLPELVVRIEGQPIPMILDTGANLCTMNLSSARRLKLKISAARATSRGISGSVMIVRTTVVPELQVGDAVLRNVAFMVLEDRDLDVPQLHYRFPGSLGFPVLSALGRITFFADGQLGVGGSARRPTPEESNFFLDRLTPVVAVTLNGTKGLFNIDTGATGSFFSALYYGSHLADFEGQPRGSLNLMGAGGEALIPVYFARSVALVLGKGCVRLEDVPVLTQPRGTGDDRFYGTIGQDVLQELQSYTFDFRTMHFRIEAPHCEPSNSATLKAR